MTLCIPALIHWENEIGLQLMNSKNLSLIDIKSSSNLTDIESHIIWSIGETQVLNFQNKYYFKTEVKNKNKEF